MDNTITMGSHIIHYIADFDGTINIVLIDAYDVESNDKLSCDIIEEFFNEIPDILINYITIFSNDISKYSDSNDIYIDVTIYNNTLSIMLNIYDNLTTLLNKD